MQKRQKTLLVAGLALVAVAGGWLVGFLMGEQKGAGASTAAPTHPHPHPPAGEEHEHEEQQLPPISAELAEEIRRLESKDWSNVEETTLPDGTVRAKINSGFRTTTVAVIDENGNVVMRHGGDFLNNVEPDSTAGAGSN